MEDHGVPPRDWITVGMAGLPSDSLPSPGVASPENASPDSAGLLTVSVSNLRFKTATTPRFVGKVKVSWPDGSPTQRKTSLSCPAGRIVVSAHIWISHGNGGSGLAHTQRADGAFHNHHDHALRASDARAQAGSSKETRAVQCRAVVCPVRAEGVPTKVATVGNQLRSSALLNY